MKLVSYNLFEGASQTRPELVEFVNNQRPDVLCLQEANGWGDNDQEIAKEFADDVNMPFWIYGDSNTRFKLFTFSRTPFVSSDFYRGGFWHCAVRTTVQNGESNQDIWNIHLNPRAEADRLAEANLIAGMIAENSILVGDFNSLSSLDGYPSGLIDELVKKGIRKFGEVALTHAVMDFFGEQGLVDVAHGLGTASPTVPTMANSDPNHADWLRLDYALATKNLLPNIVSAQTIKNEQTEKISDHYPLVVTIR